MSRRIRAGDLSTAWRHGCYPQSRCRSRPDLAGRRQGLDVTPSPAGGNAVVVVTAEERLRDAVLAIAAAAGVEPVLVPDAAQVRPYWRHASLVVVGIDQAEPLAEQGLPGRPDLFVVGGEEAADLLCSWSLPLHARVVVLPSGAASLTTALAQVTRPGRSGPVLAVVGAAGGVGASTLAAALALAGAADARRVMLVDADPMAGGIDLLLGAERTAGWRWPRLAQATGHLGDLTGQLPSVAGVDVLSMARGIAGVGVGADQLTAVLRSAGRSHDLVIVDVSRGPSPLADAAVALADLIVVVARADVRGVAAGRETVRWLEPEGRLGVVVRLPQSRGVAAESVAQALQLPLLGTLAEDPSLPACADRGEPPGRSPRSPLARTCHGVLAAAVPEAADR